MLLQATERAEAGDFAQAAELSQQLLAQDETNTSALFLLSRSLTMLGRNNDAIKALEKAVKSQPDDIDVFNLLGHLLYHSGRHEDAMDAFNRCLELKPDHVEAMRQMANLMLGSDQANALHLFKRAYALAPDHGDLLFDYAWAMTYSVGDTDMGANLFRRWLELGRGTADRGSIALQALNYASNQNSGTLARLHREWASRHTDPLGQAGGFRDHDFRADRPIRVGFLSADFCRHPVGRFALILCHHLNREQFELFVYANNEREDKLKADFEAFATWRCHHRRRVLDGCAGAMP
ncbi:MAG: tetratricopeptide repeat protein [Pedosphaera sp.]|jgi:predicted O-linked N-acetylglucosamine transferase (SPINDLY family)|nr:tetratricopeptide repeat protein [Pedosphaera sp.]